MAAWIDNDRVVAALQAGDLTALKASGCMFCVSNDGKACVVIRRHRAWQIQGGGWNEMNSAPRGSETGRDMLNFFAVPGDERPGVWFKCFLPLNIQVISLWTEGDYYHLRTAASERRASFERLPNLMWHLATGNSQRENRIVEKFEGIWEDA